MNSIGPNTQGNFLRKLFLLTAFLWSTSLVAINYESTWFTVSINPCTGYAQLDFVIYVDADNNLDDLFWEGSFNAIQMKVGSGSWVNIGQMGSGHPGGGASHYTFNNDDVFYKRLNTGLISQSLSSYMTGDNQSDRPYWIRSQFYLPPSAIGEDIQFRFGPESVFEEASTLPGPISDDIPFTPDLANISASDNTDCDGVHISWDVPNGLCSGSTTQIYRDDVQIAEVSATSLTYFDNTAVPGSEYDYKARFVKMMLSGSNTANSGSFSSIDIGKRKDVPEPPTNVQASTTDCNSQVHLQWNFVSEIDSLEIYRDGVAVGKITGNNATFTDNVPQRGVLYNYTLNAKNECGWGEQSEGVAGISPDDPEKSPNLIVSEIPGVGIQLNWVDVDLETGYQVERNLLGGGGATFFDVDQDMTEYIDESVIICQTYEYRIISINDCKPEGVAADSVRQIILTPDLSNSFNETSLSGSKGYHSNRVQLDWSVENNANFLNGFKIYRKQLDSAEDSVLIASVNSGSNNYVDNFADAGVLYEYFIIGESQCENTTIYSNVESDIGFRSPFGTVTGNVSYTGGIAVEDVRISAESTSQIDGHSVELTGADSLKVLSSPSLNFNDAFVLESWLSPLDLSSDFTIARRSGQFEIAYDGDIQSFIFSTTHTDGTEAALYADGSGVLENNFTHVAFKYADDSLFFFLNGENVASLETGTTENMASVSSPIFIGQGYSGLIDETRIWSLAKSDGDIARDHSRIMVGGEAGLKVYLRYNEGAGNWAYDISKVGNAFNKNHAEFLGSISWSETIPSESQLSIASYTNENGNYVMTVPYNGLGEGFVLTPSYLIHQFDPGTQALFIGDGQIIHNNIDFEDISSFTVTGTVFYQNSTCPAEGVSLSVDGNQVVVDGQPAQTDEDGVFNIQVPIGEHFISVSKPGHTFSVGRFPGTGKYNFQDDLAGVGFIDSTLVKVVGRVVGGLREANKKPGLGLSTNNIGVARLAFSSQLGNGCAGDTIFTDAQTGEYVTYLPPLKYVPSVGIENNPTIDFGVLDLLDLSNTPQEFAAYDTTFTTDGEVVSVDSVVYNKRLDYIHRVDPIIVVKDRDGIHDFIGDSLYTYVNPNTGDTVQRNLRTDPFRWPIFTRQDDDYKYRALIKIFERYVNADTPTLIDSVPSTDGVLTINNALADLETAQVELSKFNTPDSLRFLVYSFKAVNPNFLQNASIPDYSYTRTIEMNVVTGGGNSISWDPIPASEVPTGGDQKFRAIYLGSKTDGEQFVTAGPEVPEYVLRDPPGTGSSAKRESGSVKSQIANWSWNLDTKAHMEDAFFLGAKFTLGLGVSTATENEFNTIAGFSATISGGRKGSQSISTTNTQSWETNASGTPGSGSDLYIGQSRNIQFGVSEHLAIVPDSLCAQVECLGMASPEFQYAKRYSLAIVPGGYQTTFIYNQNNILNEQIPNLRELRNAILQSNDQYTSNLPIGDPNYGLNNDNPVFGPLVSSDNPGQGEFEDLSGVSYTYTAINLEDSLTGDSVRFINNQIRQWEEAIRLNEWEKLNIGNQTVRDSLKERELDELYQANRAMLIARGVLIAANGAAGLGVAYGLIATPVPGSSFAGYAVFAVGTGTGIAQAEIAEEYERYVQARDRIEEKYASDTPANYSISGGNTFTSSMTHATASSVTKSIEYGMSASLKIELENKVSNNGVGFKKGIELNYKSGRDWTRASTESETVSFTLSDPDETDFFSVDVYPSILGWGPIFKKQAGGQTSCPYEDEELSMFYEPGSVLSNATQQVDKPSISVSPSILFNVPVNESAVFNLTLGNESESDTDREYQVSLVSTSNPFGAIATIDGNSSISVNVPAGSSINKVLSIEKGPGAVYDYDSLLFVITAPCEGMNLADSVYVSARFIPTCTDVELVQPEEAWVANTFNNDTVPSAIAGYDINFFDFEELKIEYKPSNESQWIGLQTFYRDTSGLGNPDAIPIPTGQSFTSYDWDIAQLTDGNYDLRTRSVCALADKTSITYTGIVDRIKPHVFGTPSPGDGILSPNDDISITFNEPVDLGALTQLNFDVRGVLNGTETLHGSSLFFDGVDDYLEVSAGAPFKNRDFTIQLAVRRNGTGAETLLAQGQDEAEEIYLGFNEADQLVFRINGEEVSSNQTFDNTLWHYIGLSYSFENETADMYLANELESTVINSGNNSLFPAYEGIGRMMIGKQDYGSPGYFNGNIHEVRVWDRALSFSEFTLTMNKILSDNQAGLLYNWRMDEVVGDIAMDHVRRRDAVIYGAQWAVEPGGSSADFDGVSNYISISTGDVLITDDMNFTLEFWFKGSQTGGATLFSNGSGNGQFADSLYSWVLNREPSGAISLMNNGNIFQVTEANYFDGEWHHLAIVLNRNANITSIIDGNIENSIPSNPFRQLSGASMSMGAHVYNDGLGEVVSNYFEGEVDEFRFWNTNRKIEQVKRDQHNRMSANEPGLLLYLPFENYEEDDTGIPILTPSFSEQVYSANHPVEENGTTLLDQSPLIRIQRPVEEIAFTYSVNNDQIIITPTSASEMIENVTLDITVTGVKDLQGNIMASPVTWIAYIDKNQVVWGDDILAYEKAVGEELTFTSTIVNQGGEEKAFNLQNLPAWLTAIPSSGTINPNSSQEVSFSVDPLVNIGDYTQDVHLLTDFNYPEKLTVELKVRETLPDFDFNPADFQFSMGIIGSLEIRGISSTDVEDMLVCFSDGEVRGLQNLIYLEDIDRHLVYLDVYSNESSGEALTFKIWDASAGILYSHVDPETLPFQANTTVGNPLLPQLFETDFEIEAEIPLSAGWNWFGHYLQNPDSTDFDSLFESLQSLTGDQLNGQDFYANYSGSTGWIGPLENSGIRAEDGYKFFKNEADTLVLTGDIINPSMRTISLDQGWNWLGFISIRNQGIDQALGNLNPSEGDEIKGRSSFSVYVNQSIGWQGTLTTLTPGQGYMYKASEAQSFSYPYAGFFKNTRLPDQPLEHPVWQVDYGAFPNTMNMIITLRDSCEVPAGTLIGAFDQDGIIRGLAEIHESERDDLAFITINAENDMNLKLQVIDRESGELYPSLAVVSFEANTLKGSFEAPEILFSGTQFCEDDVLTSKSDFEVVPNIFSSWVRVFYKSLRPSEKARLVIYDMNGRAVFNERVSVLEGQNEFALQLEHLVAGPYLLKLETEHGSEMHKIIKTH